MTNDKKRVDESSEIKKEPRVKRDYSSLTPVMLSPSFNFHSFFFFRKMMRRSEVNYIWETTPPSLFSLRRNGTVTYAVYFTLPWF